MAGCIDRNPVKAKMVRWPDEYERCSFAAAAHDILKQLADGPRRPAELRAALGIASANFFTARYLTPLAKSGYIAVAGGEKNRYLPGKQYRILRILPHHYGLVRPRSPQVVLRGRSF